MKFNFLNKKAKTEENDMAEMIKGNIRYMIDFQTLPSLFFMEKQLFIENVENQRESFFADIFQCEMEEYNREFPKQKFKAIPSDFSVMREQRDNLIIYYITNHPDAGECMVYAEKFVIVAKYEKDDFVDANLYTVEKTPIGDMVVIGGMDKGNHLNYGTVKNTYEDIVHRCIEVFLN